MNLPGQHMASTPLVAGGAPRGSRWLPWPMPALVSWLAAWGVHAGVLLVAAPGVAFAAGTAVGVLMSFLVAGHWRKGLVMGGFPLSAAALGAAAGLPAWGWLAALAVLLLAYPIKAWRDAPFFPTPAGALQGLSEVVLVPATGRLLDAGCGLGHGLRVLHRLWPQARLEGVEWSPVLAAAARLACPWARVRRGDLWSQPWAGVDMVYAFQRPESMTRLWDKACAELAPGAWLVSLEFEVPGVRPKARLQAPGQRPVWIYRVAGDATASTAGQRGR